VFKLKKILVLLLLFVTLGLSACGGDEAHQMRVMVPNGIPAIAQSYIEHEQSDLYEIDRVSGPQPLVAAFTSSSHDVIIAPVNLGANLYNKQSPYLLAGIITWSNLQIISHAPIHSLTDLQNEHILAFGQGATPQIIIDYLFSQQQISVNMDYVGSSAQESYLNFLQTDDGIAIVSEPVTSTAKANDASLYVFDLADLWIQTTGMPLFPQAGIFVHQDLSSDAIDQYLNDIEDAAYIALDRPSVIAGYCENLDYPFERDIIEEALSNSGIAYQSSDQAMEAIYEFLQLIYDFKPQLIGGMIPDEDWIY
jgi:NitT/TauT family transport system substrate-binding protein